MDLSCLWSDKQDEIINMLINWQYVPFLMFMFKAKEIYIYKQDYCANPQSGLCLFPVATDCP